MNGEGMKVPLTLKANLNSFIGVVLCAWAAAMASIFFHNRGLKYAVPVLFLLFVPMVAVRCGALAGIIGSLAAALIFAIFLYQPVGSVFVVSKDARASLSWLVLGGLVFSYLLGPSSAGRTSRN